MVRQASEDWLRLVPLRAALAYVGFAVGASAMRASMLLLARDHPVRVYLTGALDKSEQPVLKACRAPGGRLFGPWLLGLAWLVLLDAGIEVVVEPWYSPFDFLSDAAAVLTHWGTLL